MIRRIMTLQFVIAKAQEALATAQASSWKDQLDNPRWASTTVISVDYLDYLYKHNTVQNPAAAEWIPGIRCISLLHSYGMKHWITEDPKDWTPEGARNFLVLEFQGYPQESINRIKEYPLCPSYGVWKQALRLESMAAHLQCVGDLPEDWEAEYRWLSRNLVWKYPGLSLW